MKPSSKAKPTEGVLPSRASRFSFLRSIFSRTTLIAFALLTSAALRFWADGTSSSLRHQVVPSNQSSRISINQADQATLESLPGIGPVLAKRIIEDRKRNGVYGQPEDLLRVSGLGQVRIDGVAPYIQFDPPPTEIEPHSKNQKEMNPARPPL